MPQPDVGVSISFGARRNRPQVLDGLIRQIRAFRAFWPRMRGCCDRTVRRATAAMRGLGLLRWQTRLVRVGWRAEQTSNAYELVPTLAAPPVLPRARCGGQKVRASRDVLIQSSLPLPSPAEAAAAQGALGWPDGRGPHVAAVRGHHGCNGQISEIAR